MIVLEELKIPYETIFLDFGKGTNGVEDIEFMKKNLVGKVPLIYDPQTSKNLSTVSFSLSCSLP